MPKTTGQPVPPGNDQPQAPLSLLHTLLTQLAATIEGPLTAELVIALCARAVQASSGAVGRCTDDGQAVEILASTGYAQGTLDRWVRLPLAAALPLPDVVRTGSALFLSSPEELLGRYPQLAAAPLEHLAWAIAPLTVGERVIGGLVLSFAMPRPFAPDDQLLISIVAQICAQALERARLAEIEREAREITTTTIHQISRAHARTQQLQQVTAALSEARTPAEVASVIVREGLAATGMDAGAVYTLGDGGQALVALASAGHPAALWPRWQQSGVAQPSPIAEALRSRDVVAVTTAAELIDHWPHLAEAQTQSGDQAALAVPLLADGQVLGVMQLAAPMPRSWSADDLAFVRTLGHLCGQALQRANLYAAEAERRAAAEAAQARSRLLAEVSQALAMAQPDFTAVLSQVLRQMGEQFADSCGVRLISDDGRELRAVGTYHRDPAAQAWLEQLNAVPIPLTGGAVAQVARSGAPLFLPVVDPDTRAAVTAPAYASYLQRFPFWSLMIVPLRARGRVLGTVKVTRSTPGQPFTADDLQLLIDLADRAALAIDNAQLYASLQQAHAAAEDNAERIGRLQVLTAALADALTPQDVARVVVHSGTAVLGAQAAMVALITDDGLSMETVGATDDREAVAHPGQRFALDAPLPSSEAARTGQLILTGSREELLTRYPQLAAQRWATFESRAAIPLRTEREPLGVLLLSFTGPRRFSAEEQDLMLLIGRQCAQALERARLYAREHQARSEAEAAVRARDQFLSIAAHELKTPLTPLLGQAQLLERRAQRTGQISEHDRRVLRVIASQAQRLDQLVRSMLDLTRLQTGRLTLQRAPLDLRDLARRLADELQPTLEGHQIALELPEEPAVVDGDALRLEQVLLNLLQNAIKYSPAGGRVGLRIALDQGHVVVAVLDGGIGIPAEALPHLFEPFFRAVNAEQHVLPGLGVGLAVVKEVVTLHGGTVTAASDEGQGSTFTITLPRAGAPPAGLGQR